MASNTRCHGQDSNFPESPTGLPFGVFRRCRTDASTGRTCYAGSEQRLAGRIPLRLFRRPCARAGRVRVPAPPSRLRPELPPAETSLPRQRPTCARAVQCALGVAISQPIRRAKPTQPRSSGCRSTIRAWRFSSKRLHSSRSARPWTRHGCGRFSRRLKALTPNFRHPRQIIRCLFSASRRPRCWSRSSGRSIGFQQERARLTGHQGRSARDTRRNCLLAS